MASQGALFAGESALPSGFVHREAFLDEREEGEILAGIATLDLRGAQYKEYTAHRRVASLGAGYDVSEYRPGTQLGWHRDIPQFEKVAGISFGGHATMRLRPFPPRKGARVLTLDLAPRSAYILQDDARWKWQHSIAPTPALRYSITFRTRRK